VIDSNYSGRGNVYPKSIQKLIDLFIKFPGIGPRQASRFVFYLLKNGGVDELIISLEELKKIGNCEQCYRTMEKKGGLCSFCSNSKRDPLIIAVVEKESDTQNMEKTGAYNGLYHILGGVISPLDSESPKKLHLKSLHERIKSLLDKNGKCEVILATGATTEGDMTALYIDRVLAPLKEHFKDLKISRLGRGLSLGSELEYADEVTLKNALANRK